MNEFRKNDCSEKIILFKSIKQEINLWLQESKELEIVAVSKLSKFLEKKFEFFWVAINYSEVSQCLKSGQEIEEGLVPGWCRQDFLRHVEIWYLNWVES